MAQRSDGNRITSRWEWVAAAVSAAIVLGMLVVLIGEAGGDDRDPDITLRVDSIAAVSHGYRATFTAQNRGTRTASSLHIRAELWEGSALVESGAMVIDYLPGESQRSGGVFFRRDPRSLRLELRALGYEDP